MSLMSQLDRSESLAQETALHRQSRSHAREIRRELQPQLAAVISTHDHLVFIARYLWPNGRAN